MGGVRFFGAAVNNRGIIKLFGWGGHYSGQWVPNDTDLRLAGPFWAFLPLGASALAIGAALGNPCT